VPKSVKVIEYSDFAPTGWCEEVIAVFRSVASLSCHEVRRFPHRIEIDVSLLSRTGPAGLADELTAVRQRTRSALQEFYAPAGALYVEYTLLTQMQIGDAHVAHADNESLGPDGRWVPNHTPWRHSVGILYLNTSGLDYDGGILRFPTVGHRVVPRAGLLVGFTSGRQHWHEVTAITRGVRYSLAMWMTQDGDYREPWDE
jgi:hypothetical protein